MTESGPEGGNESLQDAPSGRAQGNWTLPNALTILRIFMVPLLVVFLLTEYTLVGLFVFILASLTDWFDGYLARTRHQITTLGQLLDPIADKLLISAAFISLVELRPRAGLDGGHHRRPGARGQRAALDRDGSGGQDSGLDIGEVQDHRADDHRHPVDPRGRQLASLAR